MLAFVDESGDTGFKLDRGSSPAFVVAMAVFADRNEAQMCDDRIANLREELSLRASHEFHFSHNAPRVRAAFLEAVDPFAFRVHSFTADKAELLGQGLKQSTTSLYELAMNLLFTQAKPYLQDAIVTLDTKGGRHTQRRIAASLRRLLNEGPQRSSHRVKFERSSGNNLLQLADYVVALAARRNASDRDGSQLYERYLGSREATWRSWP